MREGKEIKYIPTGIKIFDTEFYILEGEPLEDVRYGMEMVQKKALAFDSVKMDEIEIELE